MELQIHCSKISEPLKWPMQSSAYDKMNDVYESFLTNVKEFQDSNAFPTNDMSVTKPHKICTYTNSRSYYTVYHLSFIL